MNAEKLTRAVLTQDGRVLIEQPDGSYRPARGRTDWDRVRAMTDAEIEFQMERLAEKKRPLDEIRDFSFARQAVKELDGAK